jgi:copper(I)-binding protein
MVSSDLAAETFAEGIFAEEILMSQSTSRSMTAYSRLRRMVLWVVLSAMPAAFAGPLSADVQVKDAWIRWLPAGIPAGGYMTLVNTGSVTYTLVGASSPDYGQIGIHQTSENQGMSEMRPVDSIALEPHTPVRFAEGSYHLMLMQPKRKIRVGDHVTVALRFADGQSLNVRFAVRAGQE